MATNPKNERTPILNPDSRRLISRMVMITTVALICFVGFLFPSISWDVWQWMIGVGAVIVMTAFCFHFSSFAKPAMIVLPIVNVLSLVLLILFTQDYRTTFTVLATASLFLHGFSIYTSFGVGKGCIAKAHIVECALTLLVLIVSFIVI